MLARHFYTRRRDRFPTQKIEGNPAIDKVIDIDQSPIGRTPRSNPATYTGLFTPIRASLVTLPEAKARGYRPGGFRSMSVVDGAKRARGMGSSRSKCISFPDVMYPARSAKGNGTIVKRWKWSTRGTSISDVLD